MIYCVGSYAAFCGYCEQRGHNPARQHMSSSPVRHVSSARRVRGALLSATDELVLLGGFQTDDSMEAWRYLHYRRWRATASGADRYRARVGLLTLP